MFRSLSTDLIVAEVKYGKCLQKKMNKRLTESESSRSCVTLFC